MFTVEKSWITKAGYQSCCLFVNDSHRCGYVGIPKDHPLHGKDYGDRLDILRPLWEKMKAGPIGKRGIIPVICAPSDDTPPSPDLVFNVHGSITFAGGGSDYPIPNDSLWWFGFDCAHSGDATQYSANGELRTLEYVEHECESLAEQLTQVMAPQEVHTITEVAADENLLRRLTGEVLNLVSRHGPSNKLGNCPKCGKQVEFGQEWTSEWYRPCPIPNPAVGSLPDIVSQLLKKCDPEVLMKSWYQMNQAIERQTMYHDYTWWIFEAIPAKQAACLLAVLMPEKVKVTP